MRERYLQMYLFCIKIFLFCWYIWMKSEIWSKILDVIWKSLNMIINIFSLIIIDYHSVPCESDKPHVDTSMIKLCKAHNSAHPPLNGISLLSSSLSSTAVSWVQQRATFLLVYPPPPSTSIGMLNSFTILTHSLETTDQWSFQIVLNIYDFFYYLVVLFILIGGTWYMLFTHKWWRI